MRRSAMTVWRRSTRPIRSIPRWSTRSISTSAATRASARPSDPRRPPPRPSGFEAIGYTVTQGASDWVFGPKDAEIQTEVLTGWAVAAREIGEASIGDIINWLARRRDHIAAGRSSMRVGHVDFFARPTATR